MTVCWFPLWSYIFELFPWRLTVVCLHVQYDRLIDSGHCFHSVPLPFIFYLLCNRQPSHLSDVSIFFPCVMCAFSFGLAFFSLPSSLLLYVISDTLWCLSEVRTSDSCSWAQFRQIWIYFEVIVYLVCWWFNSISVVCLLFLNMHIKSFQRLKGLRG